MPLLIPLAAALVFACAAPEHHDGDAIRCQGQKRSMRLEAIDAPEMPGACRPGRQCTPGDPYAARDYLSSLTAGREVECEDRGTDSYGRTLVRCLANGKDLGCAMVEGGYAVERYGRLNCSDSAGILHSSPEYRDDQAIGYDEVPAPPGYHPKDVNSGNSPPNPSPMRVLKGHTLAAPYIPAADEEAAAAEQLSLALMTVLFLNGLTWSMFWLDKDTARRNSQFWGRKQRRVPEVWLLALAAAGGSPAALLASHRLRHKTRKQPFSSILMAIAGLQIGILAGFWLIRSDLF
jgi:uncharacterized membrane protein YsdA (DUF1294 family)